jgi:hypothetical protein
MEKKHNLSAGDAGSIIPEDKVISLMDNLARLIGELTPHLDHILSDAVTADQRRSSRGYADQTTAGRCAAR